MEIMLSCPRLGARKLFKTLCIIVSVEKIFIIGNWMQELQSVQGQLVQERSRCANLEVIQLSAILSSFFLGHVNSVELAPICRGWPTMLCSFGVSDIIIVLADFWYIDILRHFQAQIAELQKVLESLPSLEEEVQALRMEKSALESDMEHAEVQKQRSGGIWKWVAG